MMPTKTAHRVVGRVFDIPKIIAHLDHAEDRTSFLKCVHKHAQLIEKLNTLYSRKPIDWENYQEKISTPGVVEFAKNAFKRLEYPYPDDVLSEDLAKMRADKLQEAALLESVARRNMPKFERGILEIDNLKPVTEITCEEVEKANPLFVDYLYYQLDDRAQLFPEAEDLKWKWPDGPVRDYNDV